MDEIAIPLIYAAPHDRVNISHIVAALDQPLDKKRWGRMIVVKRLSLTEQHAASAYRKSEIKRARMALPPSRRHLKRKPKEPDYITPLGCRGRWMLEKQVEALTPTMHSSVRNMLVNRLAILTELYQLDVLTRANLISKTNKPAIHLHNTLAACVKDYKEANEVNSLTVQQAKERRVGLEQPSITLTKIVSKLVTGKELKPDLDRQVRRARKIHITRLKEPINLKKANKIISQGTTPYTS